METREMYFMMSGDNKMEYLKPIPGVDALVCFTNDKEAKYWAKNNGLEPFKLVPVTMTYEGESEEPAKECEHEWIAQLGGGIDGKPAARCRVCNSYLDVLT